MRPNIEISLQHQLFHYCSIIAPSFLTIITSASALLRQPALRTMAKDKIAKERDPVKAAAGATGGPKKAENAAQKKHSEQSYHGSQETTLKSNKRSLEDMDDPLTSVNHDPPVSNKRQLKPNMLSSSTSLDFVPSRTADPSAPRSIAESCDYSIKESMLLCTIRQGGRTIEIYTNHNAKKSNDRDFWTMLANGIEEHKPLLTDKIFGTRILQDSGNYRIELAAHLFPNLLHRAGRFRYTEATPTERVIAKKS